MNMTLSTLHDVNLLETAELVGPLELLMPHVHCWAHGGLQALSFMVKMGGSQEPELMLQLRVE